VPTSHRRLITCSAPSQPKLGQSYRVELQRHEKPTGRSTNRINKLGEEVKGIAAAAARRLFEPQGRERIANFRVETDACCGRQSLSLPFKIQSCRRIKLINRVIGAVNFSTNFKQSIRDVFEINLLDFTERGMSTGRKLLVNVIRKNTELNLGTQKQKSGMFLMENIQHTGELGNAKKGRCRVHLESLNSSQCVEKKEKGNSEGGEEGSTT
jgi:hypothetical protein